MGSELPDYISEKFTRIDPKIAPESTYLGPWNMLLTLAFPADKDYEVVPRPTSTRPWSNTIDIVTTFVVMHGGKPVTFLEVMPPNALDAIFHRIEADKRMRSLLQKHLEDFRLPRLYSLSAFGKQFACYDYDFPTGVISPPDIVPQVGKSTDCAPRNRWSYDLVAAGGATKFYEIVKDVKQMTGTDP